MSPLDWVVVAGLLASVALGVWRGFVYEVLSVLNWLLAFVLAQWLGVEAGRMLPVEIESPELQHMAGFVLVFVVSVFVGGLLVWVLPKLIESAGLRPVDRVLGGVFGVLRAAILLLVLAVVVQLTPLHGHGWWRESLVGDLSVRALKALKPMMPESVGKYLP